MGAPRAAANPDLASDLHATADQGTAAALDFAVTEILRTSSVSDALPSVLARLAAAFGARIALAFRPSAAEPATMLAAHPPNAGNEQLLARIAQFPVPRPEAADATVQLPVMLDGRLATALVACSAPVGGQCPCAVALIGDVGRWAEQAQSSVHAVAVLVAARLRHGDELARLDDQTERLNCLIATAIPGVLFTDEHGRITHISQSFGEMFGIGKPTRLVGTPAVATVRMIEHEFADPAEFVRRAARIYRARQPTSGEQIFTADGRTIECDYWPVLIDGRYRGGLWLLWDMSDRTEIERRQEEQNARLRELDEARNQFVAMVSHELRTPLTSIVSFSELIKGEAEGLTPDGIRFLDIIERNAGRLLRLIGDLQLMSKLEAGALPLDLTPVSIPELTTEAVRTAAAVRTSQYITFDISIGTGPLVTGDSRRLLQVLDNLIGNAVKFSHRHGQVHVTATCDGQTWRIDVADTGIGIPPGEAARLFERFVRASNARTAGLPGTGLGLSIVKMIIEMHGGHVAVDTVLDRGTTFSVFIPVAREAAP